MSIKIMIVDDQRLMREGLKTILSLEGDFEVTALAENGADALKKLEETMPDVVLMDIRMPEMNGVECTAAIKQKYPKMKILVLTTFDDDEYIMDVLNNGAEGYVLKDLPSEKLISCIRDIYDGNAIMQPEIAAKIINHMKSGTKEQKKVQDKSIELLTQREREILALVGQGLSNKEIAARIFISEGTVKNYISNIYDKLGVYERSKVMIFARENNVC